MWRNAYKHDLTFPETEARYVFDRVVIFWGQDGQRRVRCAISREALDDHFKGDHRDQLEMFNENRQVIEQDARERYLAGDTEADGSILIRVICNRPCMTMKARSPWIVTPGS